MSPPGAHTETVDQLDRWDGLVERLAASTNLPVGIASRVIEEVLDHFHEPVEAFVRRRHRELKAEGLRNARVFTYIASELSSRPVAAPRLSERQIRRMIYG